ncbi:hypothetical protein ACO0LO_03375 [Undibacterium sp. TJN25]|uniref:hypothetical protein n=1 Tax=Undibacterium sp. TJN25 TaxID=3413056 RepID=UPI003BF43F41
MNRHAIAVLAMNEARLRLRRVSTLLVLLTVIVIFWSIAPNPGISRFTLISVEHARVYYTSSALAMATAKLFAVFFGLAGFYLLRGRMTEDLRSGVGSVIAASRTGNGLFLFGRWLGGVMYLGALAAALLVNILVFHSLRGDGPVQPWIYLQTYLLFLVPVIFFAASCSILFDSVAALMGKAGDVIYFFLWTLQFPLLDHLLATADSQFSSWMIFDISGAGMSLVMLSMKLGLPISAISKGVTTYSRELQAISLPAVLWGGAMRMSRCATAALALLPLLPAVVLFHRFSPDRVKAGSARHWGSPLRHINRWLQPLSRLIGFWPRLAASLPGIWGQAVADAALCLLGSPVAIAALLLSLGASLTVRADSLPQVLVASIAVWGVLISDISARDFQANTEGLSGVAPGGMLQRHLRHVMAACLLGLLYTGVIAVRWLFLDPVRAATLAAGILSISALATLLGCCSRSARVFLLLFLFWLYVANNAPAAPMLDVVGFNGFANARSIFTQLGIAVAAGSMGLYCSRIRSG